MSLDFPTAGGASLCFFKGSAFANRFHLPFLFGLLTGASATHSIHNLYFSLDKQ